MLQVLGLHQEVYSKVKVGEVTEVYRLFASKQKLLTFAIVVFNDKFSNIVS